MNKHKIIIGSRGSRLSLIQARMVEADLKQKFPRLEIQLVTVKTHGDAEQNFPLSEIGGRGVFTREIEQKLLQKQIDIAVHSLKDLPTDIHPELTLGGVLKKAENRDAFLSRDGKRIEEMGPEDAIGTSSIRRRAQLLSFHRNLKVVAIRGNVETRIKKMEQGHCSGLVLAAAGVYRAGLGKKIVHLFDPDVMMPSVCQGIIGLEIRKQESDILEIVKHINHDQSFVIAGAERSFLKTIEGGCQVPAGCFSAVSGAEFTIHGFLSDLEGTRVIKKYLSGPAREAEDIARKLGVLILGEGGRKILNGIRAKK